MALDLSHRRNDIAAIAIDPERLLGDMRRLAEFGKVGSGVHRRALSAIDVEARQWLLGRMREAGLEASIDGIGNVVGRTPHARRIVIGSHTDTVPNGGWLDGAMGVIYALEIARAFMAGGGEGEIGLEIVSFCDEEGSFTALLGSQAYVGELDAVSARALANEHGQTLDQAVTDAGLTDAPLARFDPAVHAAFLEAHIEQGPVLEAKGLQIGVVSAIVGVRGWKIRFEGRADHAGTTPMAMRADAGAALCDFAVRFAAFCKANGSAHTVWNGGAITLTPGAHNVVPALAEYILSFRDPSATLLDTLADAVTRISTEVAAEHGVTAHADAIFALAPARMDADLVGILDEAARGHGVKPLPMPSGAGHDAMVMARHMPTGMLFVPSINGRSHDLSEDTDDDDIVLGARVLADAVTVLRQRL
jgi:N-carbamoyl-L-amino-acid hydrolase